MPCSIGQGKEFRALGPDTPARREATAQEGVAMGKSRLLDDMRRAVRVRQYSYQTEKAYLSWAKRYILYHNKRHPKDMGAWAVTEYLSQLAFARAVATETDRCMVAMGGLEPPTPAL